MSFSSIGALGTTATAFGVELFGFSLIEAPGKTVVFGVELPLAELYEGVSFAAPEVEG